MFKKGGEKSGAESFPLTIKKGHASVKIYRMKQRGGWNYAVTWVALSGRQKRSFTDLELAKREAGTVAHNLAGGDLEALKLTGRERQLYVAANDAIAHTGLTLDVVAREFAAAYKVLGRDAILEAAKYFKAHAETSLPDVLVAAAVEKFAAAKKAEGMSSLYLKDIRVMLTNGLAKHFQCNLATVTAEDLRDYLNAKKDCGPVAKNNHRRLIVALFNFGKAQGWLSPDASTAADASGAYKVKAKDVAIYTPRELEKLLVHADERFLPYVALLAFGGLRREELAWMAIDFHAGTIIVPAEIAKTGRKRKITMPENLREWLAPYSLRQGPIFATDPRRRMKGLAALAGVKWKRNALRHSFGSYRMEATKNAGQVSLEMGNSAAVVMTHYFEIVDARTAAAYWGLKPTSATDAGKIVAMAS